MIRQRPASERDGNGFDEKGQCDHASSHRVRDENCASGPVVPRATRMPTTFDCPHLQILVHRHSESRADRSRWIRAVRPNARL